jgi:hypothetical protein
VIVEHQLNSANVVVHPRALPKMLQKFFYCQDLQTLLVDQMGCPPHPENSPNIFDFSNFIFTLSNCIFDINSWIQSFELDHKIIYINLRIGVLDCNIIKYQTKWQRQ